MASSSSSSKAVSLLLVMILSVWIHGASASCRRTPILFAFGDSNTDTGGASVVFGNPLQFPEGRLFFQQPTGRKCDGRLIIDLLCESLGTKFLTPYLEVFSTDFSNGVNFALAGSDTVRTNPYVPIRLEVQMMQFQRYYNLSIARGFMSEEQFRDDALYLFDIGQNDIDGNFDKKPFDRLLAQIPRTISKIKAAVKMVYGLGGRKFWIHGTGPSGCLPDSVAKKNASKPLDQYGCISQENEASVRLNAAMEMMCTELRLEMRDATVVFVDIYAIKLDLVANSTAYGFGDPFVPCSDKKAKTVCPLGARYVSWDGVHYTEPQRRPTCSSPQKYSRPISLVPVLISISFATDRIYVVACSWLLVLFRNSTMF